MERWLRALNNEQFERFYKRYSSVSKLFFLFGVTLIISIALIDPQLGDGLHRGFKLASWIVGALALVLWLFVVRPIASEALRRLDEKRLHLDPRSD